MIKIRYALTLCALLLLSGCENSAPKSDEEGGLIFTLDGKVKEKILAQAGEDIRANLGEVVRFDASKSVHKSSEIVSYEWRVGNSVLSNSERFEKSDFSEGEYSVILTIVDSKGDSSTDILLLSIIDNTPKTDIENNVSTPSVNLNSAPIAKAGDNISVNEGDIVQLDASKSSDVDGVITKYEWKEYGMILSTKKVFTKSDFSPGIHTITLYIEDDEAGIAQDTLSVTVKAELSAPIANAGSDMSARVGDSISFNASDSSDEDGTIVSYHWKEKGATLSLNKLFSMSSFGVGVHTIVLSVTDNDGLVSEDTRSITILANGVPVANAGVDISVYETQNVSFYGLSSSDSDGNIVSYSWSEGNTILSTEATFIKSDLTLGEHTIVLRVTDNEGSSSTDSIIVTINFLSKSMTYNGVVYKSIQSPHTQKIWLDRNLGASGVCTAIDDNNCYGDYYQWGREADGHEKSTSSLTYTQASSIRGNSSEFIITDENNTFEYDWSYDIDSDGVKRSNEWSRVDGLSVCPLGYRVPTKEEIVAELVDVNAIGFGASQEDIEQFHVEVKNNFLKLPAAGERKGYYQGYGIKAGEIEGLGIYVNLWSSSRDSDSTYSYVLNFGNDSRYKNTIRNFGMQVRCIKGE